jgi:DNA mismatch endonuclease (patch repair protein)
MGRGHLDRLKSLESRMDTVSPERRSAMMSRIRDRDTKPEMAVRREAHRLGFRFRLHRRDLPGTPDLVFPRHHKVMFVHGCYWHRHPGCRFAYEPKSNVEFWRVKFAGNVDRDMRVIKELSNMGWDVLTIWECETANIEILARKLIRYLGHADG